MIRYWRAAFVVAALCPSPASALWEMRVDRDAMNDTDRIEVTTDALEPLQGAMLPRVPRLQLQCSAGKAHLAFRTLTALEPIAGTSGHRMRVKLDSGKPEVITASRATNDTGISFPAAGTMVKRLLGSQTLVVEVTPVGHPPSSVTFNVQGLDRWAEEIRKACGVR